MAFNGTGDETGGLDLEGKKERGRPTVSFPASLEGVAYGLCMGVYLLELGLGQRNMWDRGFRTGRSMRSAGDVGRGRRKAMAGDLL